MVKMTVNDFHIKNLGQFQESNFEDTTDYYNLNSYSNLYYFLSKEQENFESTGLTSESEETIKNYLVKVNLRVLQNFFLKLKKSEKIIDFSQSFTNMNLNVVLSEVIPKLLSINRHEILLENDPSLFKGLELELNEKEVKKLIKALKKGSNKKAQEFIKASMAFYEEIEKKRELYEKGKLP